MLKGAHNWIKIIQTEPHLCKFYVKCGNLYYTMDYHVQDFFCDRQQHSKPFDGKAEKIIKLLPYKDGKHKIQISLYILDGVIVIKRLLDGMLDEIMTFDDFETDYLRY